MQDLVPAGDPTEPSAERHPEPVTVVSDVHLSWSGPWRRRVEGLRGIWAGSRTAVFNGDTIDSAVAADAGRSREILGHISRACEEDGVGAVFLSGNADHGISARRHLLLARGRALVAHGCVVFPDISPWDFSSEALEAARAAALDELGPERRRTLEGQLQSVCAALSAVRENRAPGSQDPVGTAARGPRWWMPGVWAVWRWLRAWRRAPSLAAALLEECAPDVNCLVMGHTHWPGVWRRRGRIVINTGSFIGPRGPWVVRVDGGTMIVRRVQCDHNLCVQGRGVCRLQL